MPGASHIQSEARIAGHVLGKGPKAVHGGELIREADLPQPARFYVNSEGYYLEDADFLRWVTGGPAPSIALEAALSGQRTMAALYDSARDGGKPVQVSS